MALYNNIIWISLPKIIINVYTIDMKYESRWEIEGK